jgi:hypothetical protein
MDYCKICKEINDLACSKFSSQVDVSLDLLLQAEKEMKNLPQQNLKV